MRPCYTVSVLSAALLASPLAAREIVHDLSGFSKIDASNHVKVNVYSGEAFRVVSDVSGTARARHLHVEQDGDTLKIWRTGDSSMILMGMADRYEVTVSMPALTSITASSGVNVEVTGTFPGISSFDAKASSGADVDVNGLEVESVMLRSSSGSDLDVRGTCTTLVAEASSGSSIDAENLKCKDAKAEASSGSEIDLYITGTLRARASSGGDIDVEGAPVDADVSISSGGDVSLPDT